MTDEAFDFWAEPDYSDQLVEISGELEHLSGQADDLIEYQQAHLEQLSYLQYLPEIYNVSCLLLGSVLAYILFTLLMRFLGWLFNDNTKLF